MSLQSSESPLSHEDDVPNDFFDDFFNEDFLDGVVNNLNREWALRYDPLNYVKPSESSKDYDEKFFIGEENFNLLCNKQRSNITADSASLQAESSNIDYSSDEDLVSSSEDNILILQDKEQVMIRCLKAVSAINEFFEYELSSHLRQEFQILKKYQSPLRKMPIIRFQVSCPLKISLNIKSFTNFLKKLGVIDNKTLNEALTPFYDSINIENLNDKAKCGENNVDSDLKKGGDLSYNRIGKRLKLEY